MNINRKAVPWGTGLFIALYFIHLPVLPPLVGGGQRNKEGSSLLYGLHQLLGAGDFLVSGIGRPNSRWRLMA